MRALLPCLLLWSACRSEPSAPAEAPAPDSTTREPAAEVPGGPLLLPGWPEDLFPRLTPIQDVEVTLRAEPDPSLPATGRCSLPATAQVAWTRSRIRTGRMGRLHARQTTEIERVSKLPVKLLDRQALEDGPHIVLQMVEDQHLEVWARLHGRCLVPVGDPSGPQLAVPCPHPGVDLVEPEQTWWLEVGCSGGEGWFRVDPERFEIGHYATRHPAQ